MFTRRKFLVQTGSTLAVSLGAAQLAQAAAVGGWAQQQGGSQDLQTGLVWLDWTLANGSIWSYSGAGTQAAAYTTADGFTGWRLPTRAEMTTAISDGIALTPLSGIPNCPLTPANGTALWWSSTLGTTKGGKAAYIMDMRTGIGQFNLIKSTSYAYAIFVRQGTLSP